MKERGREREREAFTDEQSETKGLHYTTIAVFVVSLPTCAARLQGWIVYAALS